MAEHKESSKKSSTGQWLMVLTVITVVLMVLNFAMAWSTNAKIGELADKIGSGAAAPAPAPSPAPAPNPTPQPGARVNVDFGGNAVEGKDSAKVTIIEFSDYECPFCGRFFTQTYGQIKSEYIDTGKVKLVFRDFPLSFHASAQKAAEAAECAGEQGKYYQMHDKLFTNQQALDVASLKKYAADLGLDTGKFNTCLDTGAMASEVSADFNAGQAAGVSGTPSFLIGSPAKGYTLLVGAQPYSSFKAALDAELAAN